MEDDESDFEAPVRTSPRFPSKKTRNKTHVDHFKDDTTFDNRPLKKKRTQSRAVPNKVKTKQNVGFKCSPHLMHELFKNIDTDQKKWVEELGFSNLLAIPNCRLPKGLTVWLINHVSWRKRALVIDGKTINISTIIKKVLGIPDGPLAVPLPRSKRGRSKLPKSSVDDQDPKEDKAGRALSHKETYEALIANHDPVQFKRDFMLYVLCIYFAPSSGHFINRSYLPIVSNVNLIKDMNWCQHVADFLFEGIREYRDSKAANVNVHGCVHVLLLIYIDLVKSPLITVPQGIPRAIFVTSDMLDVLESHDLQYISNVGPEYGKLEIREVQDCDEANTTSSHSTTPAPARSGTEHRNESDTYVLNDDLNPWTFEYNKIESQYTKSRDRIYSDCFKKISKIDSIRNAGIMALHEKMLMKNAPNVDQSSNAASCDVNNMLNVQRQYPVSPVHPPVYTAASKSPSKRNAHYDFYAEGDPSSDAFPAGHCTTPGKECPLGTNPEDQHDKNCTDALSPLEFSFKIRPTPDVHRSTWLSRGEEKFSRSRTGNHMESRASFDSGDLSNKSMDLLSNCRKWTAILISDDSAEKSIISAKACRTSRLIADTVNYVDDVPKKASSNTPDLFGYDVLAEVNAIGKESSAQAVIDCVAQDDGYNNLQEDFNCSFPVQCAQQQQTQIEYSSSFPEGSDISFENSTQEGNVHDTYPNRAQPFTQDDNPASHDFNDSQTQEDMFGSDSIESAAALIEQDQLISERVATDMSDTPTCQFSDVATHSTLPPPVSCLQTESQDRVCSQDSYVATYIPDSPDQAAFQEFINLQVGDAAIPGGESFGDAGSVDITVRSRAKRFGNSAQTIEGLAQLKKSPCKMKAGVSETYAEHVENSIFYGTEQLNITHTSRTVPGKPKISIRGTHLTEEEFVRALKPTGEVHPKFMWLCSVAIMLDWGSRTKTILNQSIIKELMKPHSSCACRKIAEKLKTLRLDLIDQIYLPVCHNNHWILILVSFSGELVEIYDSLRTYKRGDDPYKEIWHTIGYNLQAAYAYASLRNVPITDHFNKDYAQIHTQNNMYDCGFEVIRALICHNGKNLIGYGKKNMALYRKEVAHILLYHRYNDLNPRRPNNDQLRIQ